MTGDDVNGAVSDGGTATLVVAEVDEQRFGVDLDAVTSAIRAVAVLPVPGEPAWMVGVVNVRGALVPIVDTRVRLGGTSRPVVPSDRILLAAVGDQALGLLVDDVVGLASGPSSGPPIGTAEPAISGVSIDEADVTLVLDLAELIGDLDLASVVASVEDAAPEAEGP